MESLVDIARRSLELWTRHDIDAYMDLFHEDAVYSGPGRVSRGHDAFRKHMEIYAEAFPSERLTFIRGTQVGDDVAMLQFRVEGQHLGVMRWSNSRQIPPTGRSYRLDCVTVFHFKDRKIVLLEDFYDLYDMLFKQLAWPFPQRRAETASD
ncbi:MAG: nuclear transport factor 2 family protein [Lautropia sp.]